MIVLASEVRFVALYFSLLVLPDFSVAAVHRLYPPGAKFINRTGSSVV